MADETQRPGFRGKCLYKTGKCNNERALKTSGQAHNLCDEHRHRQNEHQRKLDAKNRFARKDKRSPNDDSPTNATAAARGQGAGGVGHRYVPYGKVRMGPNGAGLASQDDVHAILSRNGIVASSAMNQSMMQFHSLGVEGANAMAAAAAQMVGANMPSSSPEVLPSGVVILPNGPQAPQMPYPSTAMQDFDGIVVPLPSYLEGHERVEFRSRIYQKVLDFIAEECMRRFGAVAPVGKGLDTVAPPPQLADNATRSDVAGGERRGDSTDGSAEEDAKSINRDQALEGQEALNELKNATTEDGKDAGEEPHGEDGEGGGGEEEVPRSKRSTRSRVIRKDGGQLV